MNLPARWRKALTASSDSAAADQRGRIPTTPTTVASLYRRLRSTRRPALLIPLLAVTAGTVGLAQRYGGWGGGRRWGNTDSGIVYTEGGVPVDVDTVRTAREIASHSTGTPMWTNNPAFTHDTFSFVRIIYGRNPSPELSDSAGNWITDFPDSDLNLSYRLQQMTSIKVDPDGRVLRLTDPDLYNYPWIYMVEPGRLELKDQEVTILRNYLLNGGFLMADDFWGKVQWKGFYDQIKRVFPNRDFVELPMSHPIFHCVFDLRGPKEKLQVPGEREWLGSRGTRNWEYHDGEECTPIHVRALSDDKGRIMIIATHNTDNGDGWEREGENDVYFHKFSENISFPLGINIIFYAMTH